MELFGFNFEFGAKSTEAALPPIYTMPITSNVFIDLDLKNLFKRILTDSIERIQGIPEAAQPLLWDSCLASNSSKGLVTLLAEAMVNKSELFLVYDKSTGLVLKAKPDEERQIKDDYEKKASSSVGIYVNFKNNDKIDMIRFYSGLAFCTASSMYKSMNLANAIQIKPKDLRKSVSVANAGLAQAQGVAIAEALKKGKDVLIDAEDTIETAKMDSEPAKNMDDYIDRKLSLYIGMPAAWISNADGASLGDSGNRNSRDIERGLRIYYFSVWKPVLEALFGKKTSFKSEDFTNASLGLQALKDFELTDETYLSRENKTLLINRFFALPDNEDGDQETADPAKQQQPKPEGV